MQKYRNKVTINDNARLYNIWRKMKCRCYDKHCDRFKDYGARGIQIYSGWLNNFDNFADWAYANGYEHNLTIERIDNDGNYEPSNCKWITLKEQARNTRQSKKIKYKGKIKPLIVWCEELNLPYDATHNRIVSGWTVEDAFEKPLLSSDNSWAKKCREHGINPATAKDRIVKFGWTEEEALNTPCFGRGTSHNRYSERRIIAICPICGKKFIKNNSRQKYCGSQCHNKSKLKKYKTLLV